MTLFAGVLHAEVAVPPLKSRVTDLTATLTQPQQAQLEQTLTDFETHKGSQVAVLIVPTTDDESIEQYAVRVEEAWKLGRKGVDDGVLLVVAKDDRKLHIEVGYGLEGALPDAIAKRIIEEDITPRFKENDFFGGINNGVGSILKVIDGEPLPTPQARKKTQQGSHGFDLESMLVFGVVLVFVVGNALRALFGRFLGAGVVAAIAGFAVWVIAGMMFAGVAAAVVAFLFSLFAGGRSTGSSPGSWTSGGGGFGGGGFGGGGFGGGGGGGFSGGGGGSGGGGASGSW